MLLQFNLVREIFATSLLVRRPVSFYTSSTNTCWCSISFLNCGMAVFTHFNAHKNFCKWLLWVGCSIFIKPLSHLSSNRIPSSLIERPHHCACSINSSHFRGFSLILCELQSSKDSFSISGWRYTVLQCSSSSYNHTKTSRERFYDRIFPMASCK